LIGKWIIRWPFDWFSDRNDSGLSCDKTTQAFYDKGLRELAQESLWEGPNPFSETPHKKGPADEYCCIQDRQ
jgi:hypothetical protein